MENTGTIRNSVSYLTNSQGTKLAIQFNLKSKAIRELVEDFLDTLDVVDRINESSRPFENVHQEILAKRKNNV